jgi:hypothetical protein
MSRPVHLVTYPNTYRWAELNLARCAAVACVSVGSLQFVIAGSASPASDACHPSLFSNEAHARHVAAQLHAAHPAYPADRQQPRLAELLIAEAIVAHAAGDELPTLAGL